MVSICAETSSFPTSASASTSHSTLPQSAQQLLRCFNDQAAAECLGFAADGALLVLLDAVGHKTACKSLWATVVGGARRPFGISGGVSVAGGEAKQDRYLAFWTELPEHNAHNLVVCHERFLVATTDPKHVRPFYLALSKSVEAQSVGTQSGGTQNEDSDLPASLAERFAAMLNQALDLPVLPQWAGVLWHTGLRADLIEPITAGGDIAAAWKVQPDSESWSETLRDALEAGDIVIPECDIQPTDIRTKEIEPTAVQPTTMRHADMQRR